MSLMWRLLTIAVMATVLSEASKFDLEKFVRNTLVQNPDVKVVKVTKVAEKNIKDFKDWKAYMFLMTLSFRGKEELIPESVFVNEKDNVASLSLIDLKSGREIKELIKPAIPESYYDKAHFVAGSKNAPHKIVIFTDPQCPVCLEYFPGFIKDIKNNPDKFALYYYHMPLKIHPVSKTLSQAMEYLQQQGRVDEALSFYNLKINYRLTDQKKILEIVKEQLGISISTEDINKPEIVKAIESDYKKALRMMVRGTPTVFFDGKYDRKRQAYKKIIINGSK